MPWRILKILHGANQLEESWKKRLEPEFQKDYMVKLKAFLKTEKEKGRTIFPRKRILCSL